MNVNDLNIYRKYSVKAIQRQTVVGRGDRDAVLSLPS